MIQRYNLNRLSYFVATVEEGSITRAAERLGISKAVVSKQLKLLEQYVGVTLVMRNTRRIQLSDAGKDFYETSKVALLQAQQAYEGVMQRDNIAKGKIRITAPVDFGLSKLSPLLARFRMEYPDVQVELFLSDEQFDLIEHRYDLAFRVGWLQDSSYLARKLKSFEEVAVCSPKTLTNLSVTQPEDLSELPFIANQVLKGMNQWTFEHNGIEKTVALKTSMSINITLAIRDAVIASDAFTILPDFLIEKELKEKKLVRLLPNWSLRKGGVYVVSPPSRLKPKAVRVFLDMLETM